MPTFRFRRALAAAIADGSVPESRLDDMVMRMLTPMFALNLWETAADPATRNTSSNARSLEHDTLARTIAENSITLLRNEGGFLPIAPADVTNIVIFGDSNTVYGGGSGQVVAPYVITPYQGIYIYFNGAVPPTPTGNCTQEAGIDYYQQGSLAVVSATSATDCCNQCAEYSGAGCVSWTIDGNTCYLKTSADGRRPNAAVISGNCTGSISPPAPAGPYNVVYNPTQDPAAAAAAAKGADLVIMVVATDSSEGSDRSTLALPAWQDAMVCNLSAANSNLMVVARCGGLHHALDRACPPPLAPARAGESTASRHHFGDNNPKRQKKPFPSTSQPPPNPDPPGAVPHRNVASPSAVGRHGHQLPAHGPRQRFPQRLTTPRTLHGLPLVRCPGPHAQFEFGMAELLLIHGAPHCRSGHRLSLLHATVSPRSSTPAGPSGAGWRSSSGHPAAADEPPKILKGFQKLPLGPGDCAGVGFPLDATELSIWDVVAQQWTLVPGTYTLYLGSSSRDIRQTATMTV